ncbi:MAG: DUF1444 family protein [Myxococcaceae bacterium]|nr:DUF1444 family protein [Myxococcaceae bacterium]
METLRASGLRGELRYDPQRFLIQVPEFEGQSSQTIFLKNFYDEYRASPPERREEALKQLLKLGNLPKTPTLYPAARPFLLPVVRPRFYFESLKLQGPDSVTGGSVPVVWRPLGTVLGVALVQDTPDAMKYVPPEELAQWGVTSEQAFADALENLRRRSPEALISLAPGTCQSAWDDSYAASRLLLEEVIRRCKVRGDPVVLVPHRDVLLITGSRDDEGLLRVAELSQVAYEAPRSVDGRALRRAPEGWVPFLPAKGSKALPALRKLAVESQRREYSAQEEGLNAQHKRQGVDLFVAEFIPYEDEHGRVFSQAVWVKGMDTLLPRVDVVIFMDSERGPEAPPVAVVRWDVVEREAGRLLVPVEGLYPIRYQLKGFPTPEQLSRWKKDPSVMNVP